MHDKIDRDGETAALVSENFFTGDKIGIYPWPRVKFVSGESVFEGVVSFVQNPSRQTGNEGQNKREYPHSLGPSGHHPFVFLVICFFGSFFSMVMAFKSTEYADDYGFAWTWWILPIIFVCVSIWIGGHGIKSLA
jgi:hypothetical protein